MQDPPSIDPSSPLPLGAPRAAGTTIAALGWMTLAAGLFSGMSLLARVVGDHVPWQMVGATRAAVGVFVAYSFVRARSGHVIVHASRALWLRSVFGTTAMALTFYVLGSNGIALGDAATIFNLGPVFLALLAPLAIGERTGSGRLALALPLALAGVILVAKPPAIFGVASIAPAAADFELLAAAVLAAFASSVAMLGLRKAGPRESPESIALHFSIVATLAMSILSIPVLVVPAAKELALMIGAGACAGLAQIAMTRAYTIERAALVGSYGYLNVVFTALLGAIVLGERPDALALVGMAMVVSGGLVVTLAGLREERRNRP